MVLQIWRYRVEAHKGRQRNRVRPIALKRFNGILLGRAANVAALGVQNNRHIRRGAAHVRHQALQLVLSAVRGKVGDLRLEGDDQVGHAVNNCGAKIVDFAGVALEFGGKARWLRVQPDAQHGLVFLLGSTQHVDKRGRRS